MKLLVFAHIPPPHHGQSYMVQLMLNGLGGNYRERRPASASGLVGGNSYGIECYHVNTRLSKRLEDIGEFRGTKLLRLFVYCLEAIWCRFRYGVTNFYFIPAPGKSSALFRDWMVMLICRPFFKRMIFHWHAAGLAKWLETAMSIQLRAVTYHFAKKVDLSIVLSKYNMADADKLVPLRVRVVNNGIPDPCPDFAEAVLPYRRSRFAARLKLLAGQELNADDFERTGGDPGTFKVLYVAHCMKEKGLFDALRSVVLANRILVARQTSIRMKLLAAGTFVTTEERKEFDRLMTDPECAQTMDYRGFVSGKEKVRAFREADLFCFPTYYYGENQPVNLIEAMAFGLPVVTTRWRSLPEMLPSEYSGLIPPRDPDQAAATLVQLMSTKSGISLRKHFLARFTVEEHLNSLAKALRSIEEPAGKASFTSLPEAS